MSCWNQCHSVENQCHSVENLPLWIWKPNLRCKVGLEQLPLQVAHLCSLLVYMMTALMLAAAGPGCM
jgi:hypothetical protein